MAIFHSILRILNNHISGSKNCKNRKIDFSFVSEHYANFWTKKGSVLFECGEGWGLGWRCATACRQLRMTRIAQHI